MQARKLAELKRQRELRQKEFSAARHSISTEGTELVSPTPRSAGSRRELDELINTLVGEGRSASGSVTPRDIIGSPSPRRGLGSRPGSVQSATQLSGENADLSTDSTRNSTGSQIQIQSLSTQTLTTAPLSTVFEFKPEPEPEILNYSKAVQTTEPWSPQRGRSRDGVSDSEDDQSPSRTSRASKRLSRREREKDEELRENLRREIEEELKAVRDSNVNGAAALNGKQNFPARALTNEELNAVVSSNEFLDFVERSSKVIERALDQEYDILADYALDGIQAADEEDEEFGGPRGKKRRGIREIAQFWDERWSKKRMITDIGFSPKFPELILASYTKNPTAPHDPDGLVQIWNLHLHDRPEYTFHAQSDILTAQFSPFHPNLIVGGAYSGQVLLWDTRSRSSAPVQKTPLTATGHTHPIYSLSLIGTQNAHNILSCSTDGVVCGWTVDMLSQPQECLELLTPPPSKTDDLAPTCMAFPHSDPTYFLVGTEEGTIYPCHRYDRAGAKAGTDTRLSYRGHAAPIMSLSFHPARGPVDLGDLVLSSSLDWSVKLWKVVPPAATSTAAGGSQQIVRPLLDFVREDVVYDARWSPTRPGVFALVDGAGNVEVWDINKETEIPIAKEQPSRGKSGLGPLVKSLNKVAWEEKEGKRLATGGLDGVLTIFEVGGELGGGEGVKADEWAGVRRLVRRLDKEMSA
ncbi:MAG: hypothetical protein M1834_005138 [Cirrosporium novae-zelandiae]|nr:MAG: hypothetical protein M1834_005138 [Cirrosporium novae-zelandiae]